MCFSEIFEASVDRGRIFRGEGFERDAAVILERPDCGHDDDRRGRRDVAGPDDDVEEFLGAEVGGESASP